MVRKIFKRQIMYILALFPLLLGGLSACSGSSAPVEKFHAEITGAENLELAGEFAAIHAHQDLLYLQMLTGDDKDREIIITLPPPVEEGDYTIAPGTMVAARYVDKSSGEWLVYDQEPKGKVSFIQQGENWKGSFVFTVRNQEGEIYVRGDFADVRGFSDIQQPEGTPVILTDPTPIGVNSIRFLLVFSGGCLTPGLLFAHLIFQFYTGLQVFGDAENPWIASLNPVRTYLYGWRDPGLRLIMAVWSALLGLLIVSLGFFVFLLTRQGSVLLGPPP